MTWRITDRQTFETLRRSGQRARFGSLSVVFVEDGSDRIRVGYAIGRRLGGAVERNRLRRRLRAAVKVVESRGEIRPGAYLIAPRLQAANLEYPELVRILQEAMSRAQTQIPAHVGVQRDGNA